MTLIQDILCKEVEFTRQDCSLTNAKFKHSTPNEFISEMGKLGDDKKYPFFFLNSTTIEYDFQAHDEIMVSVGEIVIATKTLSTFTSEQRDTEVFRPILDPFLDAFLMRMNYAHKISIAKYGKIRRHYFFGKSGLYGTDGNVFNDSVDAIQLTNFQFKILNNKNK